jgi:glycosyltransferase involved in cell wall biosynthesis
MAMQALEIGDDWPTERAGGLSTYYKALLQHLPASDVRVHGLVLSADDLYRSTQGQVTPFATTQDNIGRRLVRLRKCATTLLDDNPIDLIASHFALYALPLLDRVRKTPLVVHFHGPWSGESNVEGANRLTIWAKDQVERHVYSRATRFIVLSQAFQTELIARYKISPELIRVIPGGVDMQRFNDVLSRSEAREKLGWPQDRQIVLSVRRQVSRMGLETLIDATEKIALRCPDVLVLLGGSGPISDQLQARILERGLEQHIRRLGRISDEDLPIAYRAANLSVVPSQALEGFGLITLESLACGTPSLVTPIGGLPEIVMPFSPACVFSGTTSDDIAQLLIQTLCGEVPLPDSSACRRYAADNFSWQHIAERVRRVYGEAIS